MRRHCRKHAASSTPLSPSLSLGHERRDRRTCQPTPWKSSRALLWASSATALPGVRLGARLVRHLELTVALADDGDISSAQVAPSHVSQGHSLHGRASDSSAPSSPRIPPGDARPSGHPGPGGAGVPVWAPAPQGFLSSLTAKDIQDHIKRAIEVPDPARTYKIMAPPVGRPVRVYADGEDLPPPETRILCSKYTTQASTTSSTVRGRLGTARHAAG